MPSADELELVMDELREMAPATATDVARETGLEPHTVRRALAELEQAGRVESDRYQRRTRVWMPT